MSKNKYKNPETLVLHSAYRSDKTTGSVTVPIYNSTAFEFESAEHAARLFALEETGNIYTRLTNPTCSIFENRLAELEGGTACLSLSSGQTASLFSILNICEAGDNFVSSTDLYGGTHTLFSSTMKKMGIEVRFADPTDPDNFRKLTDDKTRCYYAETLPNPKLRVFPIEEVANIGLENDIPLIMDNTCSPIICRPFDYGASVIVYSATKYISGHGTTLGGALIESGNFDWRKNKSRVPLMNKPDESYHGIIWSDLIDKFGHCSYTIKARCTLLRDIGGAMSPFNAYSMIQGMETLPLRMKAHCENGNKIAEYLSKHEKVKTVVHPSLMNGEAKERADKYLNNGYGALIGFELKGGIEVGKRFIDNLNLFYHVANIGDARSLAIHPASTTHQQLSKEDRLASGVTEGYIRLSIGIEHFDDLIADLSQALEKA